MPTYRFVTKLIDSYEAHYGKTPAPGEPLIPPKESDNSTNNFSLKTSLNRDNLATNSTGGEEPQVRGVRKILRSGVEVAARAITQNIDAFVRLVDLEKRKPGPGSDPADPKPSGTFIELNQPAEPAAELLGRVHPEGNKEGGVFPLPQVVQRRGGRKKAGDRNPRGGGAR